MRPHPMGIAVERPLDEAETESDAQRAAAAKAGARHRAARNGAPAFAGERLMQAARTHPRLASRGAQNSTSSASISSGSACAAASHSAMGGQAVIVAQ